MNIFVLICTLLYVGILILQFCDSLMFANFDVCSLAFQLLLTRLLCLVSPRVSNPPPLVLLPPASYFSTRHYKRARGNWPSAKPLRTRERISWALPLRHHVRKVKNNHVLEAERNWSSNSNLFPANVVSTNLLLLNVWLCQSSDVYKKPRLRFRLSSVWGAASPRCCIIL